MVSACITTAYSNEHKSVWNGKEPAAFGTDIATLNTDHARISAAHAMALAATGGGGDQKALAETALEKVAYTVTRACASHFRKTGDADRRGKVNFTKSDIARLRDRDLIAQATAIRDIAQRASSEPGASDRGITAPRIAALTAAIGTFEKLLTTPRGQIANRSALLKEVATDTAALLEDLRDLDDLIPHFTSTPEGQRFAQAWKTARVIVDAGGGHGDDEEAEDEEEPPAPAPPNP
jgi:hypothetical protein